MLLLIKTAGTTVNSGTLLKQAAKINMKTCLSRQTAHEYQSVYGFWQNGQSLISVRVWSILYSTVNIYFLQKLNHNTLKLCKQMMVHANYDTLLSNCTHIYDM